MASGIEPPIAPDNLGRWLTGRHNRLWCWGETCLAGQGPSTWIDDLEQWLRDIGDPSRWRDFGDGADTAHHSATAMGRAILAAAFLNTDRAEPFLTHLTAACQAYATALGCDAGPAGDVHVQKLRTAWGHDCSRVARLGLTDAYLTALAQAMPGEALGMARAALSDLVEPGMATRVLLGHLRHRVRTPVAFVLVGLGGPRMGVAQTLTVEWYARPGPRPVLVRDPAALGCTVLDAEFRQAESDAWASAASCFQGGGFVRWQLDVNPGGDAIAIEGNSAGGALSVALVAVAEGRRLDVGTIVLACLKRANGTAAVNDPSAWMFGKVEGTVEKAWAAHRSAKRPVQRVVLWSAAEADAVSDPAGMIQEQNPEIIVERFSTVREAVDRLSGRVAEVVKFLRDYACNGLAGSFKAFWPPGWDKTELVRFCLHTQVITDKEWSSLRDRAERHVRAGREPEERDYVPLTYLTNELQLSGEDRVHPRDLEGELNDTCRPHVLMRGEPGEGKTTALWAHIAWRCLALAGQIEAGEIGVDSPKVCVPLALPLNRLQESDLFGTMDQAALRAVIQVTYGADGAPPPVRAWLQGRIAGAGGHAYCLDALDELESHIDAVRRREWLAEELIRAAQVPVLLTSRLTANVDGLLNNRRELRVVCFGPREIRAYIGRYFRDRPHLVAQMHERLARAPGPRHLAQIPLLLSALCISLIEWPLEQFPKTRTELLGLSMHALFIRGDRERGHQRPRRSRNWAKERLLYHVAWRFHAAEPQPIGEKALHDELRMLLKNKRCRINSDPPADADALVREFERDGVLVPMGAGRYRFVLRSFHEYCLAGWIAHESPPARDGDCLGFQAMVQGGAVEWKRTEKPWAGLVPFAAPPWKNVWPLAAGQLKDRAGWLLRLYPNDNDAAPVASEAPADGEERTALEGRLILRLHDPKATADSGSCMLALGSIGGSAPLAALLERLHDPETPWFLYRACAWGLGRLGGAEALAGLVQRLRDPEAAWNLREHCAGALGQFGGTEALAALQQRLHDPETREGVREACVLALGQLGGVEALAALVQRLHDPETPEGVREHCAWALVQLGGVEALAALVQRLHDPETPEGVRERCAWALGQLGGVEALAALRQRLHDHETPEGVGMACASALGQLGGVEALAALVQRLDDPQAAKGTRSACTASLHQLGGVEALAALVQRLHDRQTPDEARAACANALGRLGGVEALAALRLVRSAPATSPALCKACDDALGKRF